MLRILVLSFLILTAAAGPVAAEVGPQGWGPRVGISSGPDQILFGAHFDFGNFAPNVGFRPHVHLGLGDNLTTLSTASRSPNRPGAPIWAERSACSTSTWIVPSATPVIPTCSSCSWAGSRGASAATA